MYPRSLKLPQHPKTTYFLWGARQVGKSSLLKSTYPQASIIDLLKNEEFTELQAHPERLRQRILQSQTTFMIIDEIQKVPALLDEVHYLIENHKVVFALCGSSARKLRSSHANLLGGRALRFELSGLVSHELGADFSLEKMLNRGYLPLIYQSEDYQQHLRSYCADYLKEEVFSEGLVRKLQPFHRFLEAAALGDTEVLSYESIARDCGISAPTVRSYYEILNDTILARFLPAYALRPKRRQATSPKFYFRDVGVVNYLSQRGVLQERSALWGKAFENWVFHEISSYLEYTQSNLQLSYWRLTTGVEVDFIVGPMKCAVEAKASANIHGDHLKGLREITKDYPEIGRRIVISNEKNSRLTDDQIEILSVDDFIKRLWLGELF